MSNHPSPVVRLRGVTKEYQIEEKSLAVLRGVTLDIEPGQVVAIVGRSGAGKSTLLHIIGGLDTATSGEVEIVGRRLQGMNPKELADFRNRNVGFVFQFHHLLPEFTALENVAMPLLIRGESPAPAAARAAELLDRVGLGQRLTHKPGELSGGERQRAAVARALITGPTCVLADEPTGNLDRHSAGQVFALMLELNRDLGTSFVVVTHDAELAARMDAIWRLDDGLLVAER